MKKFLITVIIFFIIIRLNAQTNTFPNSGAAGIGTTSPDASSLLEIKSTSKGVLIPRMTKIKRDAIASPANGLLIYQTNANPGFYYYDGSKWQAVTPKKANISLSNLNAITSINASLLPATTNTIDLGSSSNIWRTAYFNNDIHINSLTAGSGNGNIYGSTAFGVQALATNGSNGTSNTAIGNQSLLVNISGYGNTAVGDRTLAANNGNENTAIGAIALLKNTTGYYNTAVGTSGLFANTTGYENTAVGTYSFIANATGNQNTAVGYYALGNTTNSWYNTAVGANAGVTYDNGYNNVFVGASTDVNGPGYYNDIAIGLGTICTGVSQARFGNGATVSIGGYADWTNISDGRVKKNIKQNVPGLKFINMLEPITYNLDLDAADKIIQYQRKDSTGKIIQPSKFETEAKTAKEKILYTGFVAQDVEKAAKSLSYDFSGVDAAKNSKDLYGLRYGSFVVPLVKAIQELSKMNDDKTQQMDSLEQSNKLLNDKLDALTSKIDQVENAMSQCCSNFSSAMQTSSAINQAGKINDAAKLEQNIPNPFNSSSSISYYIPSSFHNAQIIITDVSGHTLKTYSISAAGYGKKTIYGNELSGGVYQYSLFIDGKLIDTKKMITAK